MNEVSFDDFLSILSKAIGNMCNEIKLNGRYYSSTVKHLSTLDLSTFLNYSYVLVFIKTNV